MSLKEAVKFRKLCTLLTKKEMHSFLFEIVSKQPELLISCMCSHFMSVSTDYSLPININNKISSIINSRESKPKRTQYFCHRKLDEIPKPLISNIASYLEQKEYANLCQTNRDIFIGCNSPQSLQNMYFQCETDVNYFPFNCDLYTSMQHLNFDLSQYRHRLSEITEPSFLDHLQSIVFSGNRAPDQFCIDYLEEDFPICESIKKLYLKYWTQSMKVTHFSFQEFILKFPNIKYLQLHSINNEGIDRGNWMT